MNRVIYSLYIDIPKKDHDIPNLNDKAKKSFIKYQDKLIQTKKKYAEAIKVPFRLFTYDYNYKKYHKLFRVKYPEITHYNIVNFYKIHLLYELAKKYDEILYLDFDVIPLSNESFFDAWDLRNGICILNNNDNINPLGYKLTELIATIRSPSAKYYNAQAMLIERGYSPENDVINTGIIGISKKHIKQLNYFKDFKKNLDFMTYLQTNPDNFWPENIVNMFGWDNETIFSYKLKETNTPVQWLTPKWHLFLNNKITPIPEDTVLVHVINKEFSLIWKTNEIKR